MSTDRKRTGGGDPGPRSFELQAVVERNDDDPDQCTIYPSGVDDHERMATWISASEPWFVRLESIR